MIRIEISDNEHDFDDVESASAFLLRKRKDGNEFSVSWLDEHGDVESNETWLYIDPMYDDQEYGEFKCSPHGADGDYDTDCTFIEASPEVVSESLTH